MQEQTFCVPQIASLVFLKWLFLYQERIQAERRQDVFVHVVENGDAPRYTELVPPLDGNGLFVWTS